MIIKSTVQNILMQLSNLLENISNDEYSRTCHTLNKSSIGQHVRHTLEFFECLFKGIADQRVNYDRRARDIFLESNTLQAQSLIDRLLDKVDSTIENCELTLIQSYGESSEEFEVRSNLQRELIYNIEHAAHHMALIRIGLKDVCPGFVLPEDFGIASSTMKHRKSLLPDH